MDENPPFDGPSQEQNPEPHRSNRRKILLAVTIFLIILATAVVYFFANGMQGLPIDLNQQAIANTTTSTTSTEANPTSETTLTTTAPPSGINSESEAFSACNNTCKELGLGYGNCLTGNATNFSCANDSASGILLNLTFPRNWCDFITANSTNQISGCCCYK